MLTTLTEVFQTSYNFSEGAAGVSFLGVALGMAGDVLLCSITLDWYTKKMMALHNDEIKPEWRLPPMALGDIIVPIGLFLYGWTAQAHVQFAVPIFGTALIGFGVYTITIPVTTYLADTFGAYAASAIAAMTMYRTAAATILPLASPPMYRALGLGWGNSVFGFVALATALVPFLLFKRSKTEEFL